MSNYDHEQQDNSSLQKIHQDFIEEMMRRRVREDDIALFIKHIKNEKDARFIEETMQDVHQVYNLAFCSSDDDIGVKFPTKKFKTILINEFLNHYDKYKNTYQMCFDLSKNCKLKDRDKYFYTDIRNIFFEESRKGYDFFSIKTEYDNIFQHKNTQTALYLYITPQISCDIRERHIGCVFLARKQKHVQEIFANC